MTTSIRLLAPLLALLLLLPAAAAADLPAGAKRLREGTVAEVLDGETLRLTDGALVRLAGIRAPRADSAGASLAGLALGRQVVLHQAGGDRKRDRHGRILAHLVRDDGLWLQDELLRQGLTRRYSQPDLAALTHELTAAEQAARAAGLGLWADPAHHPRDAGREAGWGDAVGGYHVARGRVLRAERRRERLYLNFGADWRRDVTVEIAAGDLRRFAKAGLDPLLWQGRWLEVRGWVESYNGPLIRVTHPEQIELIADRTDEVPEK